MQEFLQHPAVQGGIAPFVASLVVAAILFRFRLAGLAVSAGFATAIGLMSGFVFEPLTATRKITLLILTAPAVGVLIDFAFKPTRIGAWVLGIAGGCAALWVFLPILQQKPVAEALLPGATVVFLCAWLVFASQALLATEHVRQASAGLALGIGVGIAAILGASAVLGSYALSLGAASGGLLLLQMVLNRKLDAGATYALPMALGAGLLASAAVVLAQLPWFAALVFGLVPLAVLIPGPERLGVWAQAITYSLYGFVASACACAIAYIASRGAG